MRRYDLVIVGAGSGGIVAARVAAAFGIRVALVERGRIGGECLWTGCVPSKALVAAARVTNTIRTADRLGLAGGRPDIDTAEVWKRVRAVQEEIASVDDDPDKLRAAGIDVVFGGAALSGRHEVTVTDFGTGTGDERLVGGVILLCTGSRPAEPAIEGLADAGYLTHETVFELARPPDSLVIVGGGSVGVELAQALRRLGVRATLLEREPRILPDEEPGLADRLERRLAAEGVEVVAGADVRRVTVEEGHKVVHARIDDDGEDAAFPAAEVLVAAGRRANVDGLGLETVGVEVGPLGITVDDRGRTNVPGIYAAGDVTGPPRFTHAAAHDAVAAVRDAFLPGRGRRASLVPRCTFTDPELAGVGMTEAEARDVFGRGVGTWRSDLARTDRARTDAVADCEVVLVTDESRRLVGAHLLAPHAGEMIGELALAVDRELHIDDLARLVHVYPTLSIGIHELATRVALRRWRRMRWLSSATRAMRRLRAG
ncbi:MAG: dihydrolipoyl dehydrogenase family protein [Acidimicrobiales bacterium]